MRIKKICEWCGNEYYTGNGKAKYCSDKCRKEAYKEKQRQWRAEHPDYLKKWHDDHPDYQKEWDAKHPHYGRDRSRKRRGTVIYKRVCVVCGQPFETPFPYALTCSKECSKMLHRDRHDHRLDRLKKNGEVDTSITLERLIERDDGVCHICGGKIDKEDYSYKDGYRVTGRSYPSIDHVIPIAMGGTHTWNNVKLAHMVCNAQKGATQNA